MTAPSAQLLDDCFLHDGQRMRHADVLSLLEQRIVPVAGIETIALAEAHGRIVAAAIAAPMAVPSHTNAAVDGYAFASASYDSGVGSRLALHGRAAAGHALPNSAPSGSAVRIFTGAVVPPGCDTVVMQEDIELVAFGDQAHVVVPAGVKPGANVRKAGEDVRMGQPLFNPGHRLRATDIAALASVGLSAIACRKTLRVALFSTGDEIVRVDGTGVLPFGKVFDANAPMLAALLSNAGLSIDDQGVLPDDPKVIRRALADAAANYDVILTSGGASRGEEDHLVAAVEALGKCHLWQVAIKPGRPISFGQIGNCVVVGMPGNPVAVLICYLMYVWPLLARLSGAPWPKPRRYQLPAAFDFAGRKQGRREFWRGILVDGADGTLAIDKFKRDGSGLISGLRAADGLIEIAEERGDIRFGDRVDFIPFSEFGIVGRP